MQLTDDEKITARDAAEKVARLLGMDAHHRNGRNGMLTDAEREMLGRAERVLREKSRGWRVTLDKPTGALSIAGSVTP